MRSLGKQTVIIDVKVKSLRRAIGFYKDSLGLKILVRARNWASFKAKNIEIHLNPYWGAKAGVEFKVNKIVDWVKELKSRGVKFTSPIKTHPWGKIAYFTDSEGNELSIVEEFVK